MSLREKMMKSLIKLFFILFILFSLVSCKKYEYGPTISLRTKKERLCRSWRLNKVYKDDRLLQPGDSLRPLFNGQYYVYRYCDNVYTFLENGFYFEASSETYFTYSPQQHQEGGIPIIINGPMPFENSWKFSKNKDSLITNYWECQRSKILKLTTQDLWTSQQIDGSEYRFQYYSVDFY